MVERTHSLHTHEIYTPDHNRYIAKSAGAYTDIRNTHNLQVHQGHFRYKHKFIQFHALNLFTALAENTHMYITMCTHTYLVMNKCTLKLYKNNLSVRKSFLNISTQAATEIHTYLYKFYYS